MTRKLLQKKPIITLEVNNTIASKSIWLSRLRLDHFRNHRQTNINIFGGQLVILGDNGSGKTNLLEAVSLLAPGRGMRRAKSEHLYYSEIIHDAAVSNVNLINTNASNTSATERTDWAVAATLETMDSSINIGAGVPRASKHGNRIMRLDGLNVSQAELGTHLAVSWLTPQMDGIFLDSPSVRRRFLDRLVIAFDPAHIGRISRYEKSLRQRVHLLNERCADETWFNALESSLAETAVAVTAARQSLIKALSEEAASGWFGFPGVELLLTGDVENWLCKMPALAVEDQLMMAAKNARLNGEVTMPGPHVSEFQALHLSSRVTANRASTGQQKAMLIAIVLAHARLQDRRLGRPPIMLFDDVVAHLDACRRDAFFDAAQCLGGQCWYSGTDPEQFNELTKTAQFLRIMPGKLPSDSPVFEVI